MIKPAKKLENKFHEGKYVTIDKACPIITKTNKNGIKSTKSANNYTHFSVI